MDGAVSGWLGPRLRTEWVDGVQRLRLLPPRSWKLVFFTLLLVPVKEFSLIRDVHRPRGLLDEVTLAVVALLFAMLVVAIIGEFLGTETVGVARGELVVSRGIGPLRQTFRYAVADIAGLASEDPTAQGYRPDSLAAKRHLSIIFWKPKRGAVCFDYRGKTVYFADRLGEAEGEMIVNWLKTRLPRTATASPPTQDAGGAANWRP